MPSTPFPSTISNACFPLETKHTAGVLPLPDLRVRAAIAGMKPYLPPLDERDPEQHMLMDFNESPLPPQPEVIDSVSRFLSRRTHIYPAYGEFLHVLSNYAGVDEASLILSNGSDQGIDIVLRCFLEKGDELAMVRPGFVMFEQVASTLEAAVTGPQFPESLEFPARALKEAVTSRTRLIVVINPNNPTGTTVSEEVIVDLLQSFPKLPVLVDEAYFEFNGASSIVLLDEHPNLIILRTFSKALALSGLRLGYLIAHPGLISEFHKIRGPYDVNAAAVVAAKTQLENPHSWQFVVKHLMQEVKPEVECFFEKKGVRYFPSRANFMLVAPPDVEKAVEYFKTHGVLVRPMRPPLEHTIRLSLRMMPEMKRFMEIFGNYLNTLQKSTDAPEADFQKA